MAFDYPYPADPVEMAVHLSPAEGRLFALAVHAGSVGYGIKFDESDPATRKVIEIERAHAEHPGWCLQVIVTEGSC